MCLAICGRVVTLVDREHPWRSGVVDISGNKVAVSLGLLPEARVGDYVLVHAGVAIQVIDEPAANASVAAWKKSVGGGWGDGDAS